ncbi:MAG: CubicO group peptidase (beta-lactamase class C family) [Bacteroidia bacterium]|jgi:CubicO group peptidase (beta-lactamase class C family)
MHKVLTFLVIASIVGTSGCKDKSIDPLPSEEVGTLYFPPNSGEWLTSSLASLEWKESARPKLLELLETGKTRAFVLLKDGKIVIEYYGGKDLLNIADFDQTKKWYWASAGKTLTACMVGIADHDNWLDINDLTSDYLGLGWTSLTAEQEEKITVKHQLTMTSGLDDGVADSHNTSSEYLKFKAAAGSRWAYHNAPYTLLEQVVAKASKKDFDSYFNEALRDKIGMDGTWSWIDDDHVFFSTARSMARFGLLMLNNGIWINDTIVKDRNFFIQMVNTSQTINPAYGYLWWLNGKDKYMVPGLQLPINGPIFADAPSDMVSGLGKNGQYVNVVPSQNIVMIRMGENPDASLVPIKYNNDLWKVLNEMMN